jgi:hypothetical protein
MKIKGTPIRRDGTKKRKPMILRMTLKQVRRLLRGKAYPRDAMADYVESIRASGQKRLQQGRASQL